MDNLYLLYKSKHMTHKFEIGQEVVRSKGDYVVGRVGKVIAIDSEKNRAQVEWYSDPKTWVSFSSLELTSTPYEIIPMSSQGPFKPMWPKYKKL